MKLSAKLSQYTKMAEEFLNNHNLTRNEIREGWQAWSVAARAGITNDAYAISRDITDGHIQTVLQKIFPNAVFKDKKAY